MCNWQWIGLFVACAMAHSAAHAVDLTATERAWLEAAAPVLRFARAEGLPLDIIVQPQAAPGETPLGMAFVAGRCKLVLSMRGNPEAQAMLDRVEPALRSAVVESIAAHELGHCWRHVSQSWGTLPAELHDVTAFNRLSADHAELLKNMWRTRREEGFADLVGLAWTLKHHPTLYVAVHAWIVRLRAVQDIDTGPHDTRAWLRLAGDRSRFQPGLRLFEQVQALWVAGMLAHTQDDVAAPQRSAGLVQRTVDRAADVAAGVAADVAADRTADRTAEPADAVRSVQVAKE